MLLGPACVCLRALKRTLESHCPPPPKRRVMGCHVFSFRMGWGCIDLSLLEDPPPAPMGSNPTFP